MSCPTPRYIMHSAVIIQIPETRLADGTSAMSSKEPMPCWIKAIRPPSLSGRRRSSHPATFAEQVTEMFE